MDTTIKISGYQDLRESLLNWRIWCHLAFQDIQLRYRETVIGPLWITISTAMTICVLGFLYGYLFKSNRFEYFPHVASGMICWRLLSSLFQGSTDTFIMSKSFIQNVQLPYTIFLCRLFLKNFIIFCHNVLVFIPVVFLFDVNINWRMLFIIPAIFFVGLNTVFWGTIISMIGSRFRDFSQVMSSMQRLIFYATPIMWLPDLIPRRYHLFIDLNPFQQMLALIRKPMLGQDLTGTNLLAVAIITCSGFIIFNFFMKKYRHRIVFWL